MGVWQGKQYRGLSQRTDALCKREWGGKWQEEEDTYCSCLQDKIHEKITLVHLIRSFFLTEEIYVKWIWDLCYALIHVYYILHQSLNIHQINRLVTMGWCFRPQFSAVRLYWAMDILGYWYEFECVWIMPQMQDQSPDLLTSSPMYYHCAMAAPLWIVTFYINKRARW